MESAHPAAYLAAHGIDLIVLGAALSRAEGMARYYAKETEGRAAQNAALTAAGLKPLHNERMLKLDERAGAQYSAEAACLRAVIAYFGGDAEASERAA